MPRESRLLGLVSLAISAQPLLSYSPWPASWTPCASLGRGGQRAHGPCGHTLPRLPRGTPQPTLGQEGCQESAAPRSRGAPHPRPVHPHRLRPISPSLTPRGALPHPEGQHKPSGDFRAHTPGGLGLPASFGPPQPPTPAEGGRAGAVAHVESRWVRQAPSTASLIGAPQALPPCLP